MMRALDIVAASVVLITPCAAFAAGCTLPGQPPAKLVAMLSPDCFDAALQDRADARSAMDYGFPSRLFGLLPKAEAVELIAMAAQEGDRGFFVADRSILDHVDALSEPAADFITASLAPAETLLTGEASADFLLAVPLWGQPENGPLLTDYCARHDCQLTETHCPDRIGLADKLAVASGSMTLQQAQALCSPSFEWLRALRHAGLVDTSCTSTMQINRTMADPALLDAACYPPDLSLMDLPAATSADAVRYLRKHLTHSSLAPLPAGSLDYIASQWPELAGYLQALNKQEDKD